MPLEGEYEPGVSNWARVQAERFEASDGTEAAALQGMPIIVLTNKGAKTGKLRKTALMRVERDGHYAVVASNAGAASHPTWYWNLTANPHVELQDGGTKKDYIARELEPGAERDAWWATAVAAYPDYAHYQTRTARLIPVFELTPIDE